MRTREREERNKTTMLYLRPSENYIFNSLLKSLTHTRRWIPPAWTFKAGIKVNLKYLSSD